VAGKYNKRLSSRLDKINKITSKRKKNSKPSPPQGLHQKPKPTWNRSMSSRWGRSVDTSSINVNDLSTPTNVTHVNIRCSHFGETSYEYKNCIDEIVSLKKRKKKLSPQKKNGIKGSIEIMKKTLEDESLSDEKRMSIIAHIERLKAIRYERMKKR